MNFTKANRYINEHPRMGALLTYILIPLILVYYYLLFLAKLWLMPIVLPIFMYSAYMDAKDDVEADDSLNLWEEFRLYTVDLLDEYIQWGI